MSNLLNRRKFFQNVLGGLAATSLPMSAMASADNKLNLYNWDTYIGPKNLSDLKSKYGIITKTDYFADVDEMFAKFKAGNPGYDVAVPTHNTVKRMADNGMLEKLDHSLIPNMKNLFPEWVNLSFDKNNTYSIPYLWGTVGLGYRKNKVDENNINDMKWVFESSKYAGRIAWNSEGISMLEMAMKYLGGDPLSGDIKGLKEAGKLLEKQKKHVKVIASDNGQDLLLSGDVDIAIEYSGDINAIMLEDDGISYVAPTNGANRWVDCMVIPKNAPHVKNAHTFINHMLDAKQGKDLVEEVQYATPNKAVFDLMDDKYKNNKSLFLSAKDTKELFFQEYHGEEYSVAAGEVWTKVLAS
ncbi:MAG: ABC transporter substrate-binding protein [Alphaproteobacteria bacterium]